MLFPVSGVDVPVFVPPLAAFIVSFFCSMGGVSGAFLLLPFQMTFLGYTSPSVSATNQFYNVVAIPGGVIRYVREGRMVWPLAAVVAAGTLPGVFLGALARLVWLPDAASFRIFAACFLFWIGAKLFLGVISGKRKEKAPGGERVDGVSWSLSRVSYTYRGRAYSCPTVPLFLVSLAVGAAGGAYGIGGGSIMAPLLVSVYGLPVHTTGGATLMGTFLTSVAGVIFYSVLAPFSRGRPWLPTSCWDFFSARAAFSVCTAARGRRSLFRRGPSGFCSASPSPRPLSVFFWMPLADLLRAEPETEEGRERLCAGPALLVQGRELQKSSCI